MNMMLFLIVATVLATFGVMVAGVVSMLRGGQYDAVHELPFMEARVILQATAVGMIIIATLFWV